VRAGSLGAWLAGPTRGERGIPGSRRETAALSVAALLADGRLAESRAAPRSATGPDLDHLSLGGEGRLTIIAAAWIRLFPAAPPAALCARAKDLRAALQALRQLCAERNAPARARIATIPTGGARMAVAWEGPNTAARDLERGRRTLVALGCTPEVETAAAVEFERAAAPADVVECDATWAQLGAIAARAPEKGADLHFVGLHAGGSFAALTLADLDTDAAAKATHDAGARVTAPNRLRDPSPGWAALGAGAAWTRLQQALGVLEDAP
jgi:FAD/FMN-containing dehydrogenase